MFRAVRIFMQGYNSQLSFLQNLYIQKRSSIKSGTLDRLQETLLKSHIELDNRTSG